MPPADFPADGSLVVLKIYNLSVQGARDGDQPGSHSGSFRNSDIADDYNPSSRVKRIPTSMYDLIPQAGRVSDAIESADHG
jgi:hypothetical protein